jgi:hypothetical protein
MYTLPLRARVKPLCIAHANGKLQFEPREDAGFGKMQYSQGEQPKSKSESIGLQLALADGLSFLPEDYD